MTPRDMTPLKLGLLATTAAATALLVAGCKKTDDNTANFKSAINSYYASRPACLWSDPVRFPVQVATSDQAATQGYDALVDQGLLKRTTAEKRVFLIASKQVTNYDLSDKGRGAWTADVQQPGAGNFCFGTPTVTAIDSSTATDSKPGATTTVSYHYAVAHPPAWASAPETQNAFPHVRSWLAAPLASEATLTDSSNGWSVTSTPAGRPIATAAPGSATTGTTASGSGVSAADGQIVH